MIISEGTNERKGWDMKWLAVGHTNSKCSTGIWTVTLNIVEWFGLVLTLLPLDFPKPVQFLGQVILSQWRSISSFVL